MPEFESEMAARLSTTDYAVDSALWACESVEFVMLEWLT